MKATWRVMLEGAIDEAVLAVDLYNQPVRPRRLEGFLVHMHIAWLYLLHAEFRRAGVDIRYHLRNGRLDRVDGEPKTWDLAKCVKEKWPDAGPVRKNLELSIGLRNKVEHRYHKAIDLAATGYAQAQLLNFEQELTATFGEKYSLGEQLRFPIFVGFITAFGKVQIDRLRRELPRDTRDFIAGFESDLDASITADQRYEFRITLVPKLGPKSEADSAMTFVREDELTEEQRRTLRDMGREGTVIVREQMRPVSGAGHFKPKEVASLVQARIPYKFSTNYVSRAWRALECRPPAGDAHPERTDERYCVYDQPHRDYVYTPAFVDKLVRETGTAEKFRAFLDLEPRPKSTS
jgi:Protein of unknown function (DUF3644)